MDKMFNSDFEIIVTENAVKQFLKIMDESRIPHNYGVRIDVLGSKHSGFTYRLGFDFPPKEDDSVIQFYGLDFLIDADSMPSFNGTKLDFAVDENGSVFVFNNPNANNKCSCHEN